jgi:hypothetical protein
MGVGCNWSAEDEVEVHKEEEGHDNVGGLLGLDLNISSPLPLLPHIVNDTRHAAQHSALYKQLKRGR